MTRFKLSTLTLALLGGLALTACDNNADDTAAIDAYPADSTAATQPIDDTTQDGLTDPATVNDPYATEDPTTTMGDATVPTEDPMDQDPNLTPETDPMDPVTDPTDAVDGTEPTL